MDIKVQLLFRETRIDSYDVCLRDGKVYTIPKYAGEILLRELQKDGNKLYRLDKDYYRGYDIVSLKHSFMNFLDLSETGKREVLKRNPDLFKEHNFPELKKEIKRLQENSQNKLEVKNSNELSDELINKLLD